MAIHLDILAELDQRTVQNAAATLEQALGAAGMNAGGSFARQFAAGIGKEGGIALALTAGMVEVTKVLVSVGEEFQDLHRQLAIFSADTGQVFDELNRHANNLVGQLDTSTKTIGSTMAILEGRLNTGPSQALDTLTRHVIELQDRMGKFNVEQLAGSFRFWELSVKGADDALATLMGSAQRHQVTMQELVSTLTAAGPALRELNLSYDQSAELAGRLAAENINGGQAVLLLMRAEKAAKDQHEEILQFFRNEIVIIDELKRTRGEAAANEEAFAALGIRNWTQSEAAMRAVVSVADTMPGTFSKSGDSIDDLTKRTRELHNTWNQFTNDFKQAARPEATWVVQALDAMVERMSRLATKTDNWRDRLIGVGHVLGGLGVVGLGTSIYEGITGQPPQAKPPIPAMPEHPTDEWDPTWGPRPSAPGSLGWFDDRTREWDPKWGPRPPGGGLGWFAPGWAQGQANAGRPPLIDQDKNKGGLPGAPQIPYPAEFGQGPQPGESIEHWERRMAVIRADHDVAEAQARVEQLKKDGHATANDIVKAENELEEKKLRRLEAEQRLNQPGRGAAGGPQVPYPSGYGAPPRPGESAEQYSAETSYYEAEHKLATAQANLQQVQANSTHTAEDLIKAQNGVADAQRDVYTAALRLNDALSRGKDQLTEFGVKLDQDFGISRGLPGIAENLVRFLGNLAAAPVFGALAGANAAIGGPTAGASGLIGAAALGGAFGPQYMPGAPGFGGGSGGGGGGQYPYGSLVPGWPGGYPGGPSGVPLQYPGGSPYPYGPTTPANAAGQAAANAHLAGMVTTGPYSGPNQQGEFPQWVKDIGARFHLTPSTYGGHQTSNRAEAGYSPNPGGANRGIDWNGSPADMAAFAEWAKQNPQLFEQLIYSGGPGVGNIGIAGGRDVSDTSYYAGDYGGHGGHVHTRFGSGFDFAPGWGGPGGIGDTGVGGGAGGPDIMLAQGDRPGSQGWLYRQLLARGLSRDQARGILAMNTVEGGANNPKSLLGFTESQAQGPTGHLNAFMRQWNDPGRRGPGGMVPGVSPDGQVYDWTAYMTWIRERIVGQTGVVDWQGNQQPNPADYQRQLMAALPAMAEGGAVPILAHQGEHVLTAPDVQKMGGQQGVYAFRQALQGGTPPTAPPAGQPPAPGGPPGVAEGIAAVKAATPHGGIAATPPMPGQNATRIGGMGRPAGYGSGFAITGGGLIGVLESLPSTAAEAAIAAAAGAALHGGAIEDLPRYQEGGGVGGGGAGGAAGSITSALINIGIQEMNRAIGFAGQAAGALAGGVMETFLPAGGSQLANNNWITRWLGGIVGATPQLPNIAGPKQAPGGLTPEQMIAGAPHQGGGGAPGPSGPASPAAPLVNIENYHVASTEDRAGADLARHGMAAWNNQSLTGSR